MPNFWEWAGDEVDADRGGGGGGGGDGLGDLGSGPLGSVVDARPIEYARVLDLVSEGPIDGLVDGLKSVYLDDTPVQNSDGTLNFSGLILQSVMGTGTQAPIPGFPSTETETSVTTKVSIAGGPVTRTISTAGVSAVRVKIKVPALKVINTSNGKESGATVLFKVEIQAASYNSGVWTQVKLDGDDYWGKITGKFGTLYTRSYRIPLPSAGPWQVRVTRLTVDAPDAYTQDETWWDSYTELTDAKLCYPFSAMFALEVDSQQFRSIPRRAYEIKGRIVKVPSNYDPATRAYAGIWNGTFKDAWTDNPAWVFYDLATNTRYGAGNYLDASLLDKWSLYQCAQYCDEMVDNGRGGTEPRFACNLYLQTQEEAIRVLTNLLGVFRAMAYEAGGTIVPVQDAPSDPVAIFTNSNVREGAFTYSGTSRRQRHTAALVGWNDPNDGYRLVPEVVEDQAGIARYGYQPMEATALGCTSQGQARRYGLWLLASEMTETESVSFSAALEGAAVAPGEVIQINDQHRAGSSRWGGRIVSATTTAVTLDAPVTLGAGPYTLKCTLPDGTVESRTVSTGAGTRSTLTVGTAYSQAPGAQAQWLLMDSAVTPRLYRVVSVGEGDGLEHEILAVEHNPAKYAAVESGLTLGPGVSGGPRAFPPVTSLTLSSSVEVRFGARIMHLEAKWNPTAGATGYRAVASRDNGPWEAMEISAATARLWGAEEGSYRVRVVAVYAGGASTYAEASATVSESTAVPSGLGSAADVTAAQGTANTAITNAATAQSTANSAASAAAYADALARSSHNIVKNPATRDGAAPAGTMEAAGVIWVGPSLGSSMTSSGYVRGGSRSSAGASYWLIAKADCVPGEQFYARAMGIHGGPGQAYFAIQFQDKDGGYLSQSVEYIPNDTAVHTKDLSATAPTGAAFATLWLGLVSSDSTYTDGFFNNFYMTRKISAGMLQGDAIQTTNYAEDGSGNPTAGARMDISGTAIKVMPGGLKVGTYTFTDYFWRILQALDGASGTKVLYRGNNDTGTRGGAPDIARLTVTRRRWDTTDHVARLELKIQPQAGSDNLDAMRAAEVKLYRQNTAGDIAAITLVDAYYPAIKDRYYRNTTDSNAANAVRITFETVDPAIIYGCPAAIVTLFNAYGPSAGNCFYAGAGNADGSDLVNSGISWPTGITGGVPGDIGGGTGDLGGGCPAPWVKVQLASGLLVEAGDLYDGVQVAAVREQDMEPTVGTLREVRTIWAERVAVVLEDGRAPEFSRGHRLATIDRGWVAVQDLRPGELLVAQQESRVKAVRHVGLGQVVTFRVIGAGTYFADGILNHNEKVPL